ncbi:hypothetical protein C8J56DRAFT_814443 [Mycena floridula]|nr:hypothetical protein C8J56DRAFT_814443 [Mycena floridula]
MADPLIVPRDKLATRIIPEIVLSQGANPLTASIDLSTTQSPGSRAKQRFAVTGNAVVSGGTGNLGIAAIRAILEHGASGISIFDLQSSIAPAGPALEALKKDFPNSKILTFVVDVTDADAVDLAIEESAAELGSIDILICFAGVVSNIHAIDVKPGEWRRVMDINTTGSWLCAQAAAKKMIAQGNGGRIVLTASIAGHSVLFPQPQVAYNVSKAAILSLTRNLAGEWARYGIRVNSISPGYMDTILNHGESLEVARKIWTSRNPMGRMGDPEELTGAVVLFCSDIAGRYINGEDITVDGGGSIF